MSIEQLHALDKKLSLLSGIGALLHFDKSTLMPKKAIEQRALQLSLISTQMHEKATCDTTQKLVAQLATQKQKNTIDKAIVDRWVQDLERITKVPLQHVEEFSKLTAEAEHYWEESKAKKDFSLFAPYLERVLAMRLKEAQYIDPATHPYDVLIYSYEEGMTVKELKRIFSELKAGLQEIITKVQKSPRYANQTPITGDFPHDKQLAISNDIQERILQAPDRSARALSAHPFTTMISADDIRITTAIRDDPLFSFGSTAHECGHALYELGFAKELAFTPLYDGASLGLHESQSRFWENNITKSKAFWKFYYPYYQKEFPTLTLSWEEWYAKINQVAPSLIRIESDELTYCMHVIIRFEIEVALLEGTVKVRDLPEVWNSKYKENLGVTPSHDGEGVLQDVHWSLGSVCYFPTYALGNIYAAMIWKKMKEEYDVESDIESGNLEWIRRWLKNNIHIHGKRFLTREIIKKACGKELHVPDYIAYLKEKFYPIYGIEQYMA